MPSSLNLSGLVQEPTQLPLLDLLKAVSARREQMRELADTILHRHEAYKAGLVAVEKGSLALLDYSTLETVNKQGGELTQLCRSLKDLRSGIRSYSHQLGQALPRATEDLLRRGNAVLFDHPTSAGARYLLGYVEGDTDEYIVELLAAGEEPPQIIVEQDRSKSTQQLLDNPDLASCLSFFA